jgi:hypothetical protein
LTTSSHPDAIRELHGNELRFGTSVPYAVFLKDPPVLRINAQGIALAGEAVMTYIVQGAKAGPGAVQKRGSGGRFSGGWTL